MQRRLWLVGLAGVLALVACKADRADTHAAPAAPPGRVDGNRGWTISVRGMGPLHAGMRQREAETVAGFPLAMDGDSAWTGCSYTPDDSLPPGTHIMVEDGTIARIDVDSGATIATAEGIKRGDSEAAVRQTYAGRVTVTPHKYTRGHYLTVRSLAPADSQFRLVFETDGRQVLRFRAGRRPPVEYVEGCA